MKALNIQFNHQVGGTIQLRKNEKMSKVKLLTFKSDANFNVNININDLTDGNWTASLDWRHNNQPFFLERCFKVIDKKWFER